MLKPFDVNELVKPEHKQDLEKFFKTSTFIEASAGTGKTYSITKLISARIADTKDPLDISKILVVTFTKKAAGELKNRIGRDDAEVYTIHSFCEMVLRTYSNEANSAAQMNIVNDTKSLKAIVEKACREDWIDRDDFNKLLVENKASDIIKKVVAIAEKLKIRNGEVTPLETADALSQFCNAAAKNAYAEWKKQKLENNRANFDDLIERVGCALENSPLLRLLQDRYKLGIIDEFQDTNIAQWNIFKKIFLNKGHVIWVVGDPKQSIYSFQGSNLSVYEKAKEKIKDHVSEDGYNLSRNFRSSQAMIDACNVLCKNIIGETFGSGSKFGKPEDDPEKINYFHAEDEKGKAIPPIHFYEIKNKIELDEIDPETEKKKEKNKGKLTAQKEYYAWIVDQILSFNVGKENCKVKIPNGKKENGSPKYDPIKYSNITILGRTSKELSLMMDYLRKANIPCSRYKDKTLFEGIAAAHWAALLKGIACVYERDNESVTAIRAALLTDFFDIDIADIPEKIDFDGTMKPNVNQALALMKDAYDKYAKSRNWCAFVEKILRTSGIEMRLAQTGNAEDLAKFRQIGDYVVDSLGGGESNLIRLSNNLTQLHDGKNSVESDGDDVIGLDSNRDQVQLMTMHVSKGLEFPIVFIIGGINYEPYTRGDVWLVDGSVDSTKRNVVLNLKSNAKEKDLYIEQLKNEWTRLLYVAITRAQFVCYMPLFTPLNKDGGDKDDTLSKAIKESSSVLKKRELDNPLTITDVLKKYGISSGELITSQFDVKSILEKSQSLQKEAIEHFNGKPYTVQASSYSGLSRYKEQIPHTVNPDHNDPMPGGVSYGNAIHHILEHIDFKIGKDPNNDQNYFESIIASNMRSEGINVDKYLERYKEIITGTLNSKIQTIATDGTKIDICLGDLLPEDRRHEMNFDMNSTMNGADVLYANVGDESAVLFNGSIDLLFRKNGKWFILDWKSNKLDEGLEYNSENIHQNMLYHKYDLQCALYAEVFLDWYGKFARKTPEEVFNEDFGGVLYCYVRGCKPNQDSGFYFENWNGEYGKFKDQREKSVNVPYRKLVHGEKPMPENLSTSENGAE